MIYYDVIVGDKIFIVRDVVTIILANYMFEREKKALEPFAIYFSFFIFIFPFYFIII